MGSDFSYLDVAGRQLSQDEHSFIQETDKYFIIRSIPKDATDPYSRIDLVIKKEIELYNNTYITIEAIMENHIAHIFHEIFFRQGSMPCISMHFT